MCRNFHQKELNVKNGKWNEIVQFIIVQSSTVDDFTVQKEDEDRIGRGF